jgi:hypothetical protein
VPEPAHQSASRRLRACPVQGLPGRDVHSSQDTDTSCNQAFLSMPCGPEALHTILVNALP